MEPDLPKTQRRGGRRDRPSFLLGVAIVFAAVGLIYLAWNYFPEDPLSRRLHDHLGDAKVSLQIVNIDDFIPIGTPIDQACLRLVRAGFGCDKASEAIAAQSGFDAEYSGVKVPWYSNFGFVAAEYSVTLHVNDGKVADAHAMVRSLAL